VCFSSKVFLLLERHDNNAVCELFVNADVVRTTLAHVGRRTQQSLARSTVECHLLGIELRRVQTTSLLSRLNLIPEPLLHILMH